MTPSNLSDALVVGAAVALRRIRPGDLAQIRPFAFTVSIREPLDEEPALRSAFADAGLWTRDAGAAAIVETATGRLVGTTQFYRAAPCIHGLEIGYILHDHQDRGRGFGAQALGLITDLMFETRPDIHRLQLLIETWNVASWKLAERRAYVREGLLRSAGFGPEPADCFVYGRTRRDWAGGRDRPASLGG
jgi:RimJ/RimL family protein N-acetyltransferase